MSYIPGQLRPVVTLQNLKTAYSPRERQTISFPENSPFTKQEFKNECDINVIMSKYMFTGEMPVLNQTAPQYLDVSGVDFQESMNFVAGAKSLFMDLPSTLRNRFSNDPAAFLDFCSNEANRDEMKALGLLKPENEWTKRDLKPVDKPVEKPVEKSIEE